MRRWTLTACAAVSLMSFALLAAAVANGHGVYSFDRTVLNALGSPSSIGAWADVADVLAAPAIVIVLVIAVAFGIARRSVARIAVYAGFATLAFLMSEYVAKPLVHETHFGHLTFPSGNVTAACAAAVAMWLALRPLLDRRGRRVLAFLGAVWILVMSVAVVGAQWHTEFDALGSVLLSLGVVTAGGAAYERGQPEPRTGPDEGDLSWMAGNEDAALTAGVRGP